jgi:hypothetical protein
VKAWTFDNQSGNTLLQSLLRLLQCDEIEYGKLIWSVVGNVYSQRWLPPQSLILTNGSRLN